MNALPERDPYRFVHEEAELLQEPNEAWIVRFDGKDEGTTQPHTMSRAPPRFKAARGSVKV